MLTMTHKSVSRKSDETFLLKLKNDDDMHFSIFVGLTKMSILYKIIIINYCHTIILIRESFTLKQTANEYVKATATTQSTTWNE